MGSCVSKKQTRSNHLPFMKNPSQENAVIIIEENFKIVDYTRILEEISEIKDTKDLIKISSLFPNFNLGEVRCVKGKHESPSEHSHLIIIFSSLDGPVKEICVIIDYSPYGFAITIGEMTMLKDLLNLKRSSLELLHLPKSENASNILIGDALEWAYLHKDEEYKSPDQTPQFNMGRRMFKYVSDMLSDNLRPGPRV